MRASQGWGLTHRERIRWGRASVGVGVVALGAALVWGLAPAPDAQAEQVGSAAATTRTEAKRVSLSIRSAAPAVTPAEAAAPPAALTPPAIPPQAAPSAPDPAPAPERRTAAF